MMPSLVNHTSKRRVSDGGVRSSPGKRRVVNSIWKHAALGTWAVILAVLFVRSTSTSDGTMDVGPRSSLSKESYQSKSEGTQDNVKDDGKGKVDDKDEKDTGESYDYSYDYSDSEDEEYSYDYSYDYSDDSEDANDTRCYRGGRDDYVGPCNVWYPSRKTPADGWLDAIDFYFNRSSHEHRERCFLECIDALPKSYVLDEMLIEASRKGLTAVAARLYLAHGLNPLYRPPRDKGLDDGRGFNAIQEAIHGGYAEIVKTLSGSNNDMIIDGYGRTIRDYVVKKGSPIRPAIALNILDIDVNDAKLVSNSSPAVVTTSREVKGSSSITAEGWDLYTASDYEDKCDIDVIYKDMPRDVFIKEYLATGRPFVLRNHVSEQEVKAFSKARWDTTQYFNMQTDFVVGPTAYPSLTDQKRCEKEMTIEEIEAAAKCEEMPDIPMIHAHHPDQDEFDDLYPMYGGNALHKLGGWRKIEEYFGPTDDTHLGWQIFFGGDNSGATLHWHSAAFNILYVGIKEWILSPPAHRGFTGMPAKNIADHLQGSYTLRCIQRSGDQIFVPDYWGHATINHGFTIGAAVIVGNENYQKGYSLRDAYPKSYTFGNRQKTIPDQIPFLFIHINKTGGTSLISLLNDRCPKEYVQDRWGQRPLHRSFHSTAHSYIEHYGRDRFDQAYTFAVVRHPLARQVSNFFFLAGQCKDFPKPSCGQRFIPSNIDIFSLSDAEKIKAFDIWIWKLYKAYPRGSPNHYLFASNGHGNEEFATFRSTQTSWLVNSDGEIVVKAIYKLEDLSQDMTPLAEAIPCLRRGEAEGSKVKMVKVNPSKAYPDFMLFSKNAKTRTIIKEVFAEDFNNFGYTL